MTQGTCLCASVRYEIDGPASFMAHCHCSMCRKHHGSLFATFTGAPLSGFRWLAGESAVRTFASSPNGRRSFCSVCGSVAPSLLPEIGLAICPAGNLDAHLGMKPQSHLFVGSKAPWHTITDDLPQHEKCPPGYEAPDIVRPAAQSKDGITSGSCLCGDVAFEIEGSPLRVMNCHCSRCRRARSAAHATNLFYPSARIRWTRGQTEVVDYRLPEARYFATAFCRRCGGELPRVSTERELAVVPAGSLDTDPGAQPLAHIFVGSKASWFDITDRLPQFAEAPPGSWIAERSQR